MPSYSRIGAAALLAGAACAAPTIKRQETYTLSDLDVLQYALTAEHLENYFYTDALMKMPESEFLAAGFSSAYYNNLKYIAHDEEAHVEELTAAITAAGGTPVEACTYDFPYTDPKSFVDLAYMIETVGEGAYLGAAPDITGAAYLNVAGSILGTESIHTSIQRVASGLVGPANPYITALEPDTVYTILAEFITSCPATNAALPVMAYTALTPTQGLPAAPGISFSFSTKATMPDTFYATFVNGLVVTSMAVSVEGDMIYTSIPTTVSGTTFVLLTSNNATYITPADVIAGPAILEVTPNSPTFGIAPK